MALEINWVDGHSGMVFWIHGFFWAVHFGYIFVVNGTIWRDYHGRPIENELFSHHQVKLSFSLHITFQNSHASGQTRQLRHVVSRETPLHSVHTITLQRASTSGLSHQFSALPICFHSQPRSHHFTCQISHLHAQLYLSRVQGYHPET